MSTDTTEDVVSEYLREVELRLGGVPLLQRRELLADLETHIATARAERGLRSTAELVEVLERLGSPEVVAAAAYAEAGRSGPAPDFGTAAGSAFTAPAPAPAARGTGDRRAAWVVAAIAAALMIVAVVLCGGLLFFARSQSGPAVAPVAPAGPR